MATPPYNLDISDPTDGSLGSAFPANERTFRDNVNSYINTEHDLNTGYHAFQILTTTQKNALSSPPTGMLVRDSTLGLLQMNTGTPGSPVWTTQMSNQLFPVTNAVGATTYAAGAGDSDTMFESGSAGGHLTVTLPNTANIVAGWYCGGMQTGGNQLTFTVQGAHSETFLLPGTPASITLYNANFEIVVISYDGTNFQIISASPSTWANLNMNTLTPVTIVPPGTGTFTVLSSRCKITGVAGGGGGAGTGTSGTAGGAAGSYFVTWLDNLTVGKTVTSSVGAGGTGGGAATASGGAGANTSISSGTQTITTTTAIGGAGGITPTSPGSGAQSTGGVTATILGFANGGGINIGGINGTYGPYGDGGSISLNGAAIPAAFGGGTVANQDGYPGILVVEWL